MGLVRLAHRYLVRQTMPGWVVAHYDRMIESVAELYLAPFCEQVFAAFPGATRIVDAGTGTGVLPVILAHGNPDYRVTGIDLSEKCLQVGRERAPKEGVADRVDFQRANLERCPLEPGSVDLVLSTCSLHHWRRPAPVLRELSRLVKPSGEIWILDHSATATHDDRRQWVQKVERSAHTGLFFRGIYSFESMFLAYSRGEVKKLCDAAGLQLADFRIEGMFLLAKIHRTLDGRGQAGYASPLHRRRDSCTTSGASE